MYTIYIHRQSGSTSHLLAERKQRKVIVTGFTSKLHLIGSTTQASLHMETLAPWELEVKVSSRGGRVGKRTKEQAGEFRPSERKCHKTKDSGNYFQSSSQAHPPQGW